MEVVMLVKRRIWWEQHSVSARGFHQAVLREMRENITSEVISV